MKNEDVIKSFLDGYEEKTKHLFVEKDSYKGRLVLYSYGYHFPIAIKLKDGFFIVNTDGYSNTTARHKSLFFRALGFNDTKSFYLTYKNAKNIILKDTNGLKAVLNTDAETSNDLARLNL